MSYNLSTFFTTSTKFRGGKAVWVKDAGHESRANVLNGATIGNPYKGLGYSFAADLFEYKPFADGLLFRSFLVKTAALIDATTIVLKADGYSHVPEVGMLLMVAPATAATTGQSTLVTAVAYSSTAQTFTLTVDTALGVLAPNDILVEAAGTEASVDATVLVANPNTFIEVDTPYMPTDGSYGIENVLHAINVVYDKKAWIERMQPLPAYVLAKNRSYIDGIFWL